MSLPRLGHAIIVNNVAEEMPGSLRDVEALKAAYETVGFDVQVHYNCDTQVQFQWNYQQTRTEFFSEIH